MRPRRRNFKGPKRGNFNRSGGRGSDRPGQDPRRQVSVNPLTVSNLRKNMDINCNVAQGIGIFQYNHEESLLPYVTSINISAGLHAGDPKSISKIITIAKKYEVSTGVLIGYPDLIGNGEREMYFDVDELRALVLYQIGAVYGLLKSQGLELRHVRAHGSLYRQLYTDQLIADTVAKAISEFSSWLTLLGLGGPVLQKACINANIKIGQEVLIDRRYRRDGSVLPFSETIDGKKYIENALQRAREIIQTGEIACEGGGMVRLNPNSIHIPSDRLESIELARSINTLINDPKPINMDRYDQYFSDFKTLARM